ncbi:hypothetical protein [Okeania sp. SIO1I7]|uniref:hypothetical protein n=1 Tax=Okeania sp. SIO1I7 TaxID=2607772 RepID=UPI0013FA30E8|nr:hypothetical protein [Okeania sp. SIO1I7]NET26024.1 hypothetical protein [Okeania sp. SIO1I7]
MSSISNDFKKAIESSKASLLHEIKDLVGSDVFQDKQFNKSCISLINKVFLKVHSPITPKKSLKLLAHTFYKVALAKNYPIILICPLASETAIKEIYYFLEFTKIFRENDCEIIVHFLMIKWEKLTDIAKLSYNESQKQYEKKLDKIIEICQSIDYAFKVKVIPVDPDKAGLNFTSYHFASYFNHILKSCLYREYLDRELNRDIKWIVDFYNRQNSFHQYGDQQAIYDLAIRRAIGNLYKKEYYQSQNQDHDLNYLMITSELNKRLILCYDTVIPIINIKTS